MPAPRDRWLAFATQAAQGEVFWRALPLLRGHGVDAALCTGPSGDDPPWSMLTLGGRWQGLLLWPQDPWAVRWAHQARQLGIAVRWMPADAQEAWGS